MIDHINRHTHQARHVARLKVCVLQEVMDWRRRERIFHPESDEALVDWLAGGDREQRALAMADYFVDCLLSGMLPEDSVWSSLDSFAPPPPGPRSRGRADSQRSRARRAQAPPPR